MTAADLAAIMNVLGCWIWLLAMEGGRQGKQDGNMNVQRLRGRFGINIEAGS